MTAAARRREFEAADVRDVEVFLEGWLADRPRNTLRAYRGDLFNFARHLGRPVGEAIAWFLMISRSERRTALDEYRRAMRARSLSSSTAHRRIKVLLSLARAVGVESPVESLMLRKLSESAVAELLDSSKAGVPGIELAERFGISRARISQFRMKRR